MRAVIQRVSEARVAIDGKEHAGIGPGMLVLLGVEGRDSLEDAEWLARKISTLRIFDDAKGLMNLSLNEMEGEVLVISQFTLHAKTKKGTRPSYARAARPEQAVPLYEAFIEVLDGHLSTQVLSGVFGANMQVGLINDGPVTLIIDTQQKDL